MMLQSVTLTCHLFRATVRAVLAACLSGRQPLCWARLVLGLLLSSACGADVALQRAVPTKVVPVPVAVATHTPPPPTSALAARSGQWYAVADGIEYTMLEAAAEGRREWMTVVRLRPHLVRFRVWYEPQKPLRVRQWQQRTGAVVVVNGGFFDERYRATALVIADGVIFGRSYRGFGGMFAVRDDGTPSIVWLREQGYRASPRIVQAVQGFPMLVQDGKAIKGFEDLGRQSRRTFVALDRQGNVLLGVTYLAQWTLTDLAAYLARSSFDVQQAVNLDGGGSSGLWLRSPFEGVSMDSLDPVPAVIAVTPIK